MDAERERVQRENAAFTEWWNRVQACPEHSLITENAAHAAWQERARRTAPVSAPIGEELPPLTTGGIDANKLEAMAKEMPDECFLKGSGVLKLIAAIRQLERELAERKTASIGDDPKFRELLYDVRALFIGDDREALRALIAYIDGRTAGASPADPFAGQRFLSWNRSQEKPPVAIGKELGVARKVMELAAAPSPLNSGMEEAK
jgi:hypothetical protein